MHKLKVIYNGWGERWTLGTLAFLGGVGSAIGFEYSPQAIERGLQLSPLRQPLPRAGAAVAAFKGEAAFSGLPGFIADALPIRRATGQKLVATLTGLCDLVESA